MQITRRSLLIYGLLLTAWVLVLGWQVAEHFRMQRLARTELINHARDISSTVSTLIRVLRRGGSVIPKERLESALAELLRPDDLKGIALLNEAGDVVASAGTPVDPLPEGVVRPAELWEDEAATLINPVALGANLTHDLESTNLPIVLPFRPPDTNRPPPPPPGSRSDEVSATNGPDGSRPPSDRERLQRRTETNSTTLSQSAPPPSGQGRGRGPGPGRPRFGRPRWMSEAEFQSVIQKQGVHSFAIIMSTKSFRAASGQDLWMRAIIILLATVSALGSGFAWRNVAKSSELQIRLMRASEMNTHLRGMNLAAAGLAHETRNPLNIIRGLAQIISKQADATPEIRKKSLDVITETDRVTAQLNEFINYSRPREVRRTALALNGVVGEVVRALGHDLEEKKIRLQVSEQPFNIEADEQLLRQAVFNLLLNAIQAVNGNGEIQVVADRHNNSEAFLEIRDNGPGVPPDRRTEVFKPYFTTQQKGTGLGLAVVQQIVLAHGWEIECLANEPQGAIFRITHLKLAG